MTNPNPALMSRRTMLRATGAALALPWMESLLPRRALASTPERPKTRAAYLYFPNGVADGAWTPARVSPDERLLELNSWMAPLDPFKEDLLIPQNLWTPHGNGHSAGTATWLTGGGYDDLAIDAGGVSVDQLIARTAGRSDMIPSLQLSLKGEGFFSNNLPRNSLSWIQRNVPAYREIHPRLVYDRMFRRADEGLADHGVLDLVMDRARGLKRRLGAADQRKLDEYLEAVRDVEKRIEFAEKQAAKAGGSMEENGPRLSRPSADVPSDHQEYMRLMMDLMAMALWSGATRVATFMLDHGQSNRYFNFIDGVKGTWHALSHYKDINGKTEDDDGVTSWSSLRSKQDMYNRVTQWHHEQFAYLLGRMKELKEGDGCLLDHCLLLYGSSLADGHEHAAENLPLIIAGRGGGAIKPGRRLSFESNRSLSEFHLLTLRQMGVDAKRFGETEDALSEAMG